MTTDLRKKEVQIKEEFGQTPHRLYSSTSLFCEIPDSVGPHQFSISFPIETSLYSASTIIDKATMEGDEAELHIGDETMVAVAAAPVAIGAQVIAVNDTQYFKVGYWAFIDDGTNKDSLGRVLEVGDNSITVETPTVHAFAAMSAVKIQMKMGHSLKFAGSGTINFGTAMIGGSPIPAGTNIHVHYTNNKGGAKNLMLLLEYRY
jgi:hypothetical protein